MFANFAILKYFHSDLLSPAPSSVTHTVGTPPCVYWCDVTVGIFKTQLRDVELRILLVWVV